MNVQQLADKLGVTRGALHTTVVLLVERGVLRRIKRLKRPGAQGRSWTSVYVPGSVPLAKVKNVRALSARTTRHCPALPELQKAFRLGERPASSPKREAVTTVRARDSVEAETERSRTLDAERAREVERAQEIERKQMACAFEAGITTPRQRCSSLTNENILALPGAMLAGILE